MKIKIEQIYLKYAGQGLPQGAYLELSSEGIRASANYEIGNVVPERVFNSRARRVEISPYVRPEAVLRWIEEHRSELQAIISGFGQTWINGNCVGTLTPDAEALYESLFPFDTVPDLLDLYCEEDIICVDEEE